MIDSILEKRMKKYVLTLGIVLTSLSAIQAHALTAGEEAARAAAHNGTGEAATADDRALAVKRATPEQKAQARAQRKADGAAAAKADKVQGSGEAATSDDRASRPEGHPGAARPGPRPRAPGAAAQADKVQGSAKLPAPTTAPN
jgi:hypothetical protein